jgi:N6-adenosine-specific RNA methylase IME4
MKDGVLNININGMHNSPQHTKARAVADEAVSAVAHDRQQIGSMRLVRPDPSRLRDWFLTHGYPPPHPLALLFPRLASSEQLALQNSIAKYGMRERILVCDGQIADGVARCIALIELGIEWRMVATKDFQGATVDLRDLIIDTHVSRRNREKSQRAMTAASFATMRQGARTDLSQSCGMSQGEAADRFNVGKRLVEYAVNLQKKGTRELCNAVDEGILTVSSAVKATQLDPEQQRSVLMTALESGEPDKAFIAAVRNTRISTRQQRIVVRARSLGSRYVVLLADPPWEGPISYAENPYPRLSADELCALRVNDRLVRDLVAPDALLLLWILDLDLLNPEQPLQRIMQAWGGFGNPRFMVWPKPHFSVGAQCRSQHELLLMAPRGNFPPPEESRRFSSLIVDPQHFQGGGFRVAQPHDQRHSSKPDRFQEMIEQAYPQFFGPETLESPLALELFSRRYRAGWDGWGNDYPGRPSPEFRPNAAGVWIPQTPAS